MNKLWGDYRLLFSCRIIAWLYKEGWNYAFSANVVTTVVNLFFLVGKCEGKRLKLDGLVKDGTVVLTCLLDTLLLCFKDYCMFSQQRLWRLPFSHDAGNSRFIKTLLPTYQSIWRNIPNKNTLQNIEGAKNLNVDTEDDLCLILSEEYDCVWQSHWSNLSWNKCWIFSTVIKCGWIWMWYH